MKENQGALRFPWKPAIKLPHFASDIEFWEEEMKNLTSQGLIRIAGNFQGCYGTVEMD